MIRKKFYLVFNLNDGSTIETGFKVVQNDVDAYTINAVIFDGSAPIDYELISSATITYEKPDGKIVQRDMTVESNMITCIVKSNEISVLGVVKASIQLYGEDDERLSLLPFTFEVTKDMISPPVVESTNEFPILQKLVQDVHTIIPMLPEIQQIAFEMPGIIEFFDAAEVSEVQRVANENIRQAQEAARQASIADIINQFNNLVTAKQQEAEVIIARDGEANLKARLDRDKQELSSQLAENVHVINMYEWGLIPENDNSDIINQKIANLDSNKTYKIYTDEIYCVASPIIIDNKKLIWTGKGGLKALAGNEYMVVITNCPKIEIRDLTFDGNTIASRAIDIENSKKFEFNKLSVINVGNAGVDNVSGIFVSYGCDGGIIKDCDISDILAAHNATGISIDNFRNNTKYSKYINIEHCNFENISPADDADGIKILMNGADTYPTIRDCHFNECKKRGIKIQTRQATTENNVIINSEYAGIDFQCGYGKSINDKIYFNKPDISSDNAIAIGGDYCEIVDAELINTSNNQAYADGFIINNLSGTVDLNSLIIKNVRFDGFRFPFIFSGINSIDKLIIKDCKFNGFTGNYVFASPLPTINNLWFQNNFISSLSEFWGVFAGNSFGKAIITDNIAPSNMFDYSPRTNFNMHNNIGQRYDIIKGQRISYEANIPSNISGSAGNIYKTAKKGDICYNTNITVLGSAGSQYIVPYWICTVDGDGSTTQGTWLEVKVLTGT